MAFTTIETIVVGRDHRGHRGGREEGRYRRRRADDDGDGDGDGGAADAPQEGPPHFSFFL